MLSDETMKPLKSRIMKIILVEILRKQQFSV